MRIEKTNCGYCSKQIRIRHSNMWREGKKINLMKALDGAMILTDGSKSSCFPICREHYGKLVKIFTSNEVFFRNNRGQIQRF